MHDLTVITAFRKVAESKNFTLAAQELQMTPSAVSRQITRLEDQLGVQLLVRTTRSVRLTSIGEEFHRLCAKGLTEIDHALQMISRDQKEPRGVLRVGVTPFFGKTHLVPAILEFLAKYPKVSADVSLAHSGTSFHESGIDILVRAGAVRGQGILHENLAPMRHIICATPSYLETYGTPRTPKDLMRHNCLLSTASRRLQEWPFTRGRRREYVQVSGTFRADSVEAIYRAVTSSVGIARLANYVVDPDLRSGALVSLFPRTASPSSHNVAYDTSTNVMKAYYVKSKYPDPKIKLFIRFLKARFSGDYDWENRGQAL